MLVQATSLNNNAVRSLEDRQIVGRINDLIVDPKNGQILALVLSKIWGMPKVISPMDIIGFSPGIVIIKNRDSILSIKDIVRAWEVWKQKIHIIGSTCKTESGKILGNIEDYLIDLKTMTIIKYYISGNHILSPFAPNRIILASKTIKIKKDLILVQDEEKQMSEKEIAKASTDVAKVTNT